MVSFEMDDALAAEMDSVAVKSGMTRSAFLRQAVREHLDRLAKPTIAPPVEMIHAVVRVGDPPWNAFA